MSIRTIDIFNVKLIKSSHPTLPSNSFMNNLQLQTLQDQPGKCISVGPIESTLVPLDLLVQIHAAFPGKLTKQTNKLREISEVQHEKVQTEMWLFGNTGGK